MSLVFISPLFEIFTPTNSSSIAMVEYDLCRAAQAAGIEPFVIARRSKHATFDWPRTILVDYPNLPNGSLKWWLARAERKIFGWEDLGDHTYAHRIVQTIAKNKLDRYPIIVHGNAEPALLFRRKFPHAFIAYWCHGAVDFQPHVREKLRSAVDLAIGVSDFQSRWIEKHFGFAPQQVATVYNGIDTEHFSPAPEPMGSTPGLLTVNYTGRVNRDKGLDVLLRAALEVAETMQNFQIQVIGSDKWEKRGPAQQYRRELQTLIDALAQRSVAVHESGHVGRERIPELLRRSQIHVVPTRCDEAFGLSTLEGMACGVPTIASRTGGTPEIATDAALLFEREDASGLAVHLRALLKSPLLREEYARRGLARSREFPRERMWTQLSKLLPATTL